MYAAFATENAQVNFGKYGSVDDMKKQFEDEYLCPGGEHFYENPHIIVYYMDEVKAYRVKYLENSEEYAEFLTQYHDITDVTQGNVKIVDKVMFDKHISSDVLKAACTRYNAGGFDYVDWMMDLRKNFYGFDFHSKLDFGYATENAIKNLMNNFFCVFQFEGGSMVTKRDVFVFMKDYYIWKTKEYAMAFYPVTLMSILKWWGYEMDLKSIIDLKRIWI